jgi:hypothetical protein
LSVAVPQFGLCSDLAREAASPRSHSPSQRRVALATAPLIDRSKGEASADLSLGVERLLDSPRYVRLKPGVASRTEKPNRQNVLA